MKANLLLLLLLLFGNYSRACDCDSIVGKKDAKKVFEGKVLGIKRIEEPFIRYEITFQVSKMIKGKIKGRTIIVNISCLMVACCGLPFEINDNYIVYTFLDEDMLYTSLCTSTKKLNKKYKQKGR